MSKHTPGPWATDEADHDMPCENIKIKAGKYRTICTVWIDDAPVHDFNAEQRLNARLIAAAPDLLEALKKIAGDVCDNEYTRTARAALAQQEQK